MIDLDRRLHARKYHACEARIPDAWIVGIILSTSI